MPKILLTKAYNNKILQKAFGLGYEVASEDFIESNLVDLDTIRDQIPENSNHFIVTSLRAAKHITALDLHGAFYCVGDKAANYLKTAGKVIKLIAVDARDFLNQIEENSNPKNSFVYFCSDLRKNTLPDGIRNLGYELIEIITYKVTSKKVEIDNDFEAIAFFSPSGVKSYAQQYDIPKKAIIFALGNTTANAVENMMHQKAFTPPQPHFESLTQTIKAYLDAKK